MPKQLDSIGFFTKIYSVLVAIWFGFQSASAQTNFVTVNGLPIAGTGKTIARITDLSQVSPDGRTVLLQAHTNPPTDITSIPGMPPQLDVVVPIAVSKTGSSLLISSPSLASATYCSSISNADMNGNVVCIRSNPGPDITNINLHTGAVTTGTSLGLDVTYTDEFGQVSLCSVNSSDNAKAKLSHGQSIGGSFNCGMYVLTWTPGGFVPFLVYKKLAVKWRLDGSVEYVFPNGGNDEEIVAMNGNWTLVRGIDNIALFNGNTLAYRLTQNQLPNLLNIFQYVHLASNGEVVIKDYSQTTSHTLISPTGTFSSGPSFAFPSNFNCNNGFPTPSCYRFEEVRGRSVVSFNHQNMENAPSGSNTFFTWQGAVNVPFSPMSLLPDLTSENVPKWEGSSKGWLLNKLTAELRMRP